MLSMIRIRHELSILPIGIYTIKIILDPLEECLCNRLIVPATNRPHSAIAVSPVG